MYMDLVELTNYVKFQLSASTGNTDPVVAEITDEQIHSIIQVQCGTLGLTYPKVPYDYVTLLMCLVKKELYWKLATASAPLTPISTDGTSINKDIRFDHYFKLIEGVTKEYEAILEDPTRLPEDFNTGKASVKSYDMFIRKGYAMQNFIHGYKVPKVNLNLDSVAGNEAKISIDLSKVNPRDFYKVSFYVSDKGTILDEYSKVLSSNALQCLTSFEFKRKLYSLDISNLTSMQTLNVLMVVELTVGLKATNEIEVTLNA